MIYFKIVASEDRLRVGRAQEPECTVEYMRVSRALLGSHASRASERPRHGARAGSTTGAPDLGQDRVERSRF